MRKCLYCSASLEGAHKLMIYCNASHRVMHKRGNVADPTNPPKRGRPRKADSGDVAVEPTDAPTKRKRGPNKPKNDQSEALGSAPLIEGQETPKNDALGKDDSFKFSMPMLSGEVSNGEKTEPIDNQGKSKMGIAENEKVVHYQKASRLLEINTSENIVNGDTMGKGNGGEVGINGVKGEGEVELLLMNDGASGAIGFPNGIVGGKENEQAEEELILSAFPEIESELKDGESAIDYTARKMKERMKEDMDTLLNRQVNTKLPLTKKAESGNTDTLKKDGKAATPESEQPHPWAAHPKHPFDFKNDNNLLRIDKYTEYPLNARPDETIKKREFDRIKKASDDLIRLAWKEYRDAQNA